MTLCPHCGFTINGPLHRGNCPLGDVANPTQTHPQPNRLVRIGLENWDLPE